MGTSRLIYKSNAWWARVYSLFGDSPTLLNELSFTLPEKPSQFKAWICTGIGGRANQRAFLAYNLSKFTLGCSIENTRELRGIRRALCILNHITDMHWSVNDEVLLEHVFRDEEERNANI